MLSLSDRLADTPPSCTLWWVRAQLGRTDLSDKRFVGYAQLLVDQCQFPPPFPSLLKGRRGLIRRVTPHSTFRRAAVEAWLALYLPPAAEAALDAEAQARAAQAMDQAAQGLGPLRLVDGGRA
jgi:hypothetical protein